MGVHIIENESENATIYRYRYKLHLEYHVLGYRPPQLGD